MDEVETKSARGTAATDRQERPSAVTSARAQFDAVAGATRPAGSAPAVTKAVFDRLDWSGAVGPTVQAATVHMEGRRDGAREVLLYDLDGTGLLAHREEAADGRSVSLHFVSASSRAAYERVLRSVGYLNRAAKPHAGERHFDVEVVDATGFPVKLGERALWVEARTAAAAAAEAFDTVSPEVIRFDLDDHVADAAVAFDDAAFAAQVEPPAAREPQPAAPVAPPPSPATRPAATAAPGDGDRFAALYGDTGYSVHRQSPARAAAARGEPDSSARTPAPSVFRDGAQIYRIYRPAGATASPEQTPQAATLIVEAPAAFTQDDRVRVFRRRTPAPAAEAVAAHRAPATADREALHFADMFEGEVDPNGLERNPLTRAERDFLFGLGRSQAA